MIILEVEDLRKAVRTVLKTNTPTMAEAVASERSQTQQGEEAGLVVQLATQASVAKALSRTRMSGKRGENTAVWSNLDFTNATQQLQLANRLQRTTRPENTPLISLNCP